MSLLSETKRILQTYDVVPKRDLGQNFLVSDDVLSKMILNASLTCEDVVLEVGAGLGFLTEYLAEKAKEVIAVEIDPMLTRILQVRLARHRNIVFVQGDVMKTAIPPFNKVVSTPPYSISSPLLSWLLLRDFQHAVLTLQEEFANKLIAAPGSRDYGRISILANYRADTKLLDDVPSEMFWPPPKVNSKIVSIRSRKNRFYVENEEIFLEFIQMLFTQRNRKLRNAVLPFLSRFKIPKKEATRLAESLPFHFRRARDLMPEEIGLMFNEVIGEMCKLNLL